MIQIGIDPTDVRTSAQGSAFALGTEGEVWDPLNGYKRYVYCSFAGGATGAGYVCDISADAAAAMSTVTTTAPGTGAGKRVGVASAAIAAGGFGWLQVYGECAVRVAASCAAYTNINSTATAGQLDDDATAGAEVIEGLVLGTANGGAAGNAVGFANYPIVGRTL